MKSIDELYLEYDENKKIDLVNEYYNNMNITDSMEYCIKYGEASFETINNLKYDELNNNKIFLIKQPTIIFNNLLINFYGHIKSIVDNLITINFDNIIFYNFDNLKINNKELILSIFKELNRN